MGSEAELVMRAATGDREAFDAVTEPCRPWLFGICFRLVRDREAAEDLVQEALMVAFRCLPQLREPSSFRPWLSRIAFNTCRMHLRRLSALPESAPLPEAATPPVQTAWEPPSGLNGALAHVDPASRRLLMLFYSEGLSHAELAEALSLSVAGVKSRLHRARERLRREMLEMMTPEERARLGAPAGEPWSLRTVLLVEPDDGLRAALRDAIAAAGYEVVLLPTGEAALESVAQRRGQMVVLDKHCVEPNWVEVLTLLQADAWARENVPVGVLVDGGNRRDITLAWHAGAALCLTRPPDVDELVKFIRKIERLWPEELRPRSAQGS